MNAHTIGTYQVPGGETYTLTVPEDEIGRAKITACLGMMETAGEAGDRQRAIAWLNVLLSVLTGRSVEEIAAMVDLGTVALMWRDIQAWTDHLRPVATS
jgi:hypothetical protein